MRTPVFLLVGCCTVFVAFLMSITDDREGGQRAVPDAQYRGLSASLSGNRVAARDSSEVGTESRRFGAGDLRHYTMFFSGPFRRMASWADGKYVVKITDHENDLVGNWYTSEYQFSTSFAVHSVSARWADEMYVAGIARSGEDVIERWAMATPDGSYTTGVVNPSTAIGSPASVSSPSVTVAGGGAFVSPASRSQRSGPLREELFRGDLGGLVSLTPELDGRYLLVLNQLGEVLQLVPTSTDPSVFTAQATIADAAGTPGLLNAKVLWLAAGGADTCIVAEKYDEQDGEQRVYLWDLLNDGAYDVIAEYSIGDSSDPYDLSLFPLGLWN